MKRYIVASSEINADLLDKLHQHAGKRMKELGGCTNCKILSQELANISEGKLDVLSDNLTVLVPDSDGFKIESSHVVNITPDTSCIYDFTFDQFLGNTETSDVCIAKKVAPGVYFPGNAVDVVDILDKDSIVNILDKIQYLGVVVAETHQPIYLTN